jgi:hypothetical protein
LVSFSFIKLDFAAPDGFMMYDFIQSDMANQETKPHNQPVRSEPGKKRLCPLKPGCNYLQPNGICNAPRCPVVPKTDDPWRQVDQTWH